MLVVACAESAEDVPPPLRRCFTHELPLEAPDEAQRLALLQGLLAPGRVDEGALAAAASQTAGLLPGDLRAVAADAAAAAVRSLLPWRVRAPDPTMLSRSRLPSFSIITTLASGWSKGLRLRTVMFVASRHRDDDNFRL